MTQRGAMAGSSGRDDRLAQIDRETSGVHLPPEDTTETADLPIPAVSAAPRRASRSNGALSSDLLSDPPPPPEVLEPGTLIADRFRVGRMIGRGGHGFVYEAEHVVLGYPVAIKVLCAAYGHDARRRARFRREALLGARLRHRNVASIHDAGELEDGSPFLVMEHVDGDDLATVITRVGTLDAAATAEIGVQLLAAVIALCERGVIHRDIKPNNVMLQRSIDGYVEVKLLDFGISKAMRAELALKTLTADDCVLGTPQYMSPEQVKGEPLDVRADLYSVGALLYECLTGTPPFDAETPGAVLAKILTEEAPAVRELRPDVPGPLGALIDRAVAKRPDDRWRSPAEMAEALRAIAQRLHLPRGADAWSSLTRACPPASMHSAALGLDRPERTSSAPPAASEAKKLETAAERPVSKRVPSLPETREPTQRLLLERLVSLRAQKARGRRWVALAAVVPMVLGLGAAAWTWRSEPVSRGDNGVASQGPTTGENRGEGPALAEATAAARAVGAPTPTVGAPPSAATGERDAARRELVAGSPERVEPTAPAEMTAPAEAIAAAEGTAPAEPIEGARGERRGPDVAGLERRALSAFLAGRDAEAVSLYTRATQIAPGRASAWRGLGLASASQDRRTAARALRRYLEIAPHAADRRAIERRLARM